MPMIELSDDVFARAQSLAVPLVDTPNDVVDRALKALQQLINGSGPDASSLSSSQVELYRSDLPPDLTHSQPTSIKVGAVDFVKSKLYWNHLMLHLINVAIERGIKGKNLLELMVVPTVIGKKTDQGYQVIPHGDISIQGQDSNGAWRQSRRLAKALGMKLDVTFKWQDTPKAKKPGGFGRFIIDAA